MGAHLWEILAGINPRTVVDVFSALLTPVIAIVTAFVAYQQWKVNKIRLDLERYDRRLAIYKAVDAFYANIDIEGTATYQMVSELRHGTAEAAFLFPAEIENHLAEVKKKAMRVASLRELTSPSSGGPGLPVGPERDKACEEEGELHLWLLKEAKPESRKRFSKYLKLA
jgi:hypothetical protein